MAIDTRRKRQSALNFRRGHILPNPSGTVDQAERQTFVNFYSGILAAGAAAIIVPLGRIVEVLLEPRTVFVDAEDRTIAVLAEDRIAFAEEDI